MNPFDVFLLVLLLILTLAGALWGAARVLMGMVGFAAAFVLAIRLSSRGPDWFSGWIDEPGWARLAAFSVVFLGAMLAALVAALAVRRFLKAVMLGWADRLAGGAVGFAMAVVAGVALTVPLTALPPEDRPVLEDSILAPWALGVAGWIGALVPDDVSRRYGEGAETLRRAWRDVPEEADDPQR